MKRILASAKKINIILNHEFKRRGILLLVLLFLGAFMEMLSVSAVVPFLTRIFDFVQEQFVWSAIILIMVYLTKNLYFVFLSFRKAKYWKNLEKYLSVRLLEIFLDKEYIYYTKHSSSNILRVINSDTVAVASMINSLLCIVTELVSVIMISSFLFVIEPVMASSILVFCFLGMGISLLLFKRRMTYSGNQIIKNGEKNYKVLYQSINGIKEVKIDKKEKFFLNEYANDRELYSRALIAQWVAGECPAYLIEFVVVMGFIVMLCARVILYGGEADFVANMGAFAVAAFRMLPAFGKITSNYNNIIFYIPALDSVYENWEKEQSKKIGKNAEQKTCFEYEMKLENIYWKYDDQQTDVLTDFNLKIEKGTCIGIVGASGIGKSTMIDILFGLLQPAKGQIWLDGNLVKERSQEWNSLFAYVPQNIFLFDDSIKKNIALGINDEKIDLLRIESVSELAGLKEFLDKLPEGIETKVGENALRLSGGQKQRIAIARALYKDAPILILDEATSSLDRDTEKGIIEEIIKLKGNKTIIMITHKVDTVGVCDIIYKLESGRLIKLINV